MICACSTAFTLHPSNAPEVPVALPDRIELLRQHGIELELGQRPPPLRDVLDAVAAGWTAKDRARRSCFDGLCPGLLIGVGRPDADY